MLDEEKLTSMLKTHTQNVAPTPELWDRIACGAGGRPQQRRRFALPVGLRRGLEVVAVCAVLAGIAILPLLRHDNVPDAPGGAPKSTQTPPTAVQTVEGVPLAVDVTKAYFGGFPGAGESPPLDEATVTKVLGWLNGAQVVGHDADINRKQGLDFHLVMQLRNGGQVMVRRAEDCQVTKSDSGTRTTCSPAQDHVNLITAGSGDVRLLSPALWNWLRYDGTTTTGSGVVYPNFTMMNINFTAPSSPAKITAEQAREVTAQHIGQPPADAKVTVEHWLMTMPDGTFGRKWENYPVYLVTYDGVTVRASGPPPQGAAQGTPPPTRLMAPPNPDMKGTITAFIDANTGEWIQAIGR